MAQKISPPSGFDCRSVQPTASSYTDCTVLAAMLSVIHSNWKEIKHEYSEVCVIHNYCALYSHVASVSVCATLIVFGISEGLTNVFISLSMCQKVMAGNCHSLGIYFYCCLLLQIIYFFTCVNSKYLIYTLCSLCRDIILCDKCHWLLSIVLLNLQNLTDDDCRMWRLWAEGQHSKHFFKYGE
jgi:hypothetical protein